MPTAEGIRESMRLLALSSLGRSPASEEEFDAIAGVWGVVMPEVSDEQLVGATVAYLRSGAEWWPTPGQLYQRIPREVTAPSGDQAWALVIQTMRRQGYMRPPCPSDLHADGQVAAAMLEGIATLGGWRSLCMSEERELAFSGKTFARVYDAALAASAQRVEREIIACSVAAILPDAPPLFAPAPPAPSTAPAATQAKEAPRLTVASEAPDLLDDLTAERTRRIERARAIARARSGGGAQ